jgi:2,4-dienoyl-CoA reductase (NADPH2)
VTGPIFTPLRFRNLELKNRVLRSSIAGRFDGYDGTGSQARINWEVRFARGGVGAIVSAWCGVDRRGFIVPGYASIENDERIPFWREVGDRVHAHDCKFILQLAHGGRQRDIGGIEFARGLSSTSKPDPLHGFPAERATQAQLGAVVRAFAEGARRAREAGLDGVEIHGANGYIFTQFLSSAINDRRDEYGGPLEHRARLLLETVRGVRAAVGNDFHLQVKLSATEHGNAFLPWLKHGNRIDDSVQVCRWLEEAGADAIHVSAGNTFPHPVNPAGDLPLREVVANYDGLVSSGRHVLRNYVLYRLPLIKEVMRRRWARAADEVEGAVLGDARAVREAVSIPVLCTGGFQTASVVAAAIERGDCDAVSIARPLVANPDLLDLWRAGHDRPPRPCTFSNKCLFMLLEHPLGCYDESRYATRDEMLREIYEVYDPPSFGSAQVLEGVAPEAPGAGVGEGGRPSREDDVVARPVAADEDRPG